jgi:hypothetical protein
LCLLKSNSIVRDMTILHKYRGYLDIIPHVMIVEYNNVKLEVFDIENRLITTFIDKDSISTNIQYLLLYYLYKGVVVDDDVAFSLYLSLLEMISRAQAAMSVEEFVSSPFCVSTTVFGDSIKSDIFLISLSGNLDKKPKNYYIRYNEKGELTSERPPEYDYSLPQFHHDGKEY